MCRDDFCIRFCINICRLLLTYWVGNIAHVSSCITTQCLSTLVLRQKEKDFKAHLKLFREDLGMLTKFKVDKVDKISPILVRSLKSYG